MGHFTWSPGPLKATSRATCTALRPVSACSRALPDFGTATRQDLPSLQQEHSGGGGGHPRSRQSVDVPHRAALGPIGVGDVEPEHQIGGVLTAYRRVPRDGPPPPDPVDQDPGPLDQHRGPQGGGFVVNSWDLDRDRLGQIEIDPSDAHLDRHRDPFLGPVELILGVVVVREVIVGNGHAGPVAEAPVTEGPAIVRRPRSSGMSLKRSMKAASACSSEGSTPSSTAACTLMCDRSPPPWPSPGATWTPHWLPCAQPGTFPRPILAPPRPTSRPPRRPRQQSISRNFARITTWR